LRKTQRLERNLEPHHVAAPGQTGIGLPQHVEREVGFGLVIPDSILLNSLRIQIEEHPVLSIMKSVENETELIVIVDSFAAPKARTDFVRLGVEADTHNVEILVRIAGIDFCFL